MPNLLAAIVLLGGISPSISDLDVQASMAMTLAAQKYSSKTCLCSKECVCGCNVNKPCKCKVVTVKQMPQQKLVVPQPPVYYVKPRPSLFRGGFFGSCFSGG